MEVDVAFGQAPPGSIPTIRFVLEELHSALPQRLTESTGPYVEHGTVDVEERGEPRRRAPSTFLRRASVGGIRVPSDREREELAIVGVPAQVVQHRAHPKLGTVHLVTRAGRSQSQVNAFISRGIRTRHRHRLVRKHQGVQPPFHLDRVAGAEDRGAMATAHVVAPVIEMR
jgi:hypothetical protein